MVEKLWAVAGAWYLQTLPNHIVMEQIDGTLAKFAIAPFRLITPEALGVYKGYHPRKCKGQPVPEYLYRFYGLERNAEALSEVVRLRLSPGEKEKLDTAAKNAGQTVSEFVRKQIHDLP